MPVAPPRLSTLETMPDSMTENAKVAMAKNQWPSLSATMAKTNPNTPAATAPRTMEAQKGRVSCVDKMALT